jgi:CTP:molybdopterin cytidylyltransferase MocA
MKLAILLLAAGQSSRMRGADKMHEPVDGRPLLTVMAERAQATGVPVWVTLPAADHPRTSLLPDGAAAVAVPDAPRGMSASIRDGVRALPEGIDAVMILPADMPEITSADLSQLVTAYRGGILRATTEDGIPGHPVIFPKECFADLQDIQGDQGAKGIIFAYDGRIDLIALPGRHALIDLDTPEAWQEWRAQR